MKDTLLINEQDARLAFDSQSALFDETYASNTIIRYKRERVRAHVTQYLATGTHILELNAGTGDDAIFFAGQGHTIHTTDISQGMLERLKEKVQAHGLTACISNEVRSYTRLNELRHKGPYDLIFSNFAGLNCTAELQAVLNSFDGLLKPGGYVTLVMLPRFCLWETLLIFKGKFGTATRRFLSPAGRTARVNGNEFKCWYYNPSTIIKAMEKKFDVIALEGLCTLVPPSYIENFAEKYPTIYNALCKKENNLKDTWPWKYIGDYYIITLRKKAAWF